MRTKRTVPAASTRFMDRYEYSEQIKNALAAPTLEKLRALVSNGLDIFQKNVIYDNFHNGFSRATLHEAILTEKWIHAGYLLDVVRSNSSVSEQEIQQVRFLFRQVILQYFQTSMHGPEAKYRTILKMGHFATEADLFGCIRMWGPRHCPRLLRTLIQAGLKEQVLRSMLFSDGHAVNPGNFHICIRSGIDVNFQRDSDGSTLMHHYVTGYLGEKLLRIEDFFTLGVKVLLAHNVDLSLHNHNGETATDLVPDHWRPDFERLRLEIAACREEAQTRILAVCMASHVRLGVDSQAKSLSSELFEMICGSGYIDPVLVTLQIARVLPSL